MIVIKDARKIYRMGGEEIKALDGLSLKINEGEFIALIGPSGSGKSTLMNVIGALDSLDNGSIIVDGKDISKLSDNQQALYRRKRVGFVFQTFNLQSRLTALENVELPLIFDNVPARKRAEIALDALKKVKLSDRLQHKPSELSGGQQQRVAIARAIANKPSILLADEPTGNLDSKSGEKIMQLLKQFNEREQVTIIMVTHNERHAAFAGRVLHMLDGKIIQERNGTR